MKKENYHTHTTGSDGAFSPEELVKLAIKKKFDVLGITDHYHTPPGFRKWGEGYYPDGHYLEVKRLKKKYKGKIKVFVNVEFDWLKDYRKWIKHETTKRKYDYRFGSVHFLKIGKEYYSIEHAEKLFKEMAQKVGGIKKLIRIYYGEVRKAVKSGFFDVVSHMDLIKFWNKNEKYFSEDEDWYRKEVVKTLKAISKAGMKIDLNAKGLRKPCEEQCPSGWIVGEAKKMGIGLLIGTDAHRAGDLEAGLKEVERLKND